MVRFLQHMKQRLRKKFSYFLKPVPPTKNPNGGIESPLTVGIGYPTLLVESGSHRFSTRFSSKQHKNAPLVGDWHD